MDRIKGKIKNGRIVLCLKKLYTHCVKFLIVNYKTFVRAACRQQVYEIAIQLATWCRNTSIPENVKVTSICLMNLVEGSIQELGRQASGVGHRPTPDPR